MLDEDRLSVNRLQANLGGGTLNGAGKLRPEGEAMEAQAVLKVNGLDVDFIAKRIVFDENPGGKLDRDLEVGGYGGSIAEIMAGLNGKVLLRISNSRISNKAVSRVISNIGSPGFRIANPFSHDPNFTKINCFVARFHISNGRARSTALLFDTNLMNGAGEGSLNLKNESLDFSFSTAP